jgi:hypothetical protein
MQSSDLKTEAGLRHFKELLNTAEKEGKGNLIELLAAASEEIASARQ